MLVAETHAAVDLWCVDLDVDEPQFDAHTTVLNAAEWERARRFRFERQARRWSFSRAALRDILSRYTLTPPQKNCVRSRNEWQASALGATGSSPFQPVPRARQGLDWHHHARIEWLREIPDAGAVARHFFTAREVEAYQALPAALRARGFLNCWTRKEAVVKATGVGLATPLDSFEVSLDPRQPARLHTSPAMPGEGRCGWLQHVDAAPDYVAAVALCGAAVPRVVLRHWPQPAGHRQRRRALNPHDVMHA